MKTSSKYIINKLCQKLIIVHLNTASSTTISNHKSRGQKKSFGFMTLTGNKAVLQS